MTGSKKLSRQNRQKTEQLCLSLVCRHKTSSVGWDLLGQCLRGPLRWQEQWNLSDAWERGGVKERFPSLEGISWVHRARWITSPQQHQEGSLRETWCPYGWKKRGGLQGSSKQAAVFSESWQPMVMATLHWKLSLRGWCSRYRGYRALWPALRLPKWAPSHPCVQQHPGCWRGGLVCEQVLVMWGCRSHTSILCSKTPSGGGGSPGSRCTMGRGSLIQNRPWRYLRDV